MKSDVAELVYAAIVLAFVVMCVIGIPLMLYKDVQQTMECEARGGLMSREFGCIKVQRPPPLNK